MMFGTCTGTIPTGLILLRMVDSELKTTVSVEAGHVEHGRVHLLLRQFHFPRLRRLRLGDARPRSGSLR